jgi:predicted SnoaL-like aldol condensation-catalyzing enzyme
MTSFDNKAIVQQALGALLASGDVDALASFLSDGFVHHRPDATDSDKAQWLDNVRAALGPIAGMEVDILHLLADGDHVVMHSRRRLPGGGPEIVVVDVWRLEAGLIAEAWEVIEPVAQAKANLAWWAA